MAEERGKVLRLAAKRMYGEKFGPPEPTINDVWESNRRLNSARGEDFQRELARNKDLHTYSEQKSLRENPYWGEPMNKDNPTWRKNNPGWEQREAQRVARDFSRAIHNPTVEAHMRDKKHKAQVTKFPGKK
jgi:hypothetical protein